jgi:histidine triad (HIT) family protein
MGSIFSKIVTGEVPSYKVAETEDFLAFLDVFPLKKGHTLVIPKKEIDYIFDIEDRTFQAMFLFAKKVAIGLKEAIPCKKISIQVIGLEVPHAHIHLIPINSLGDCDFTRPKLTLSKEEMSETAKRISEKIR